MSDLSDRSDAHERSLTLAGAISADLRKLRDVQQVDLLIAGALQRRGLLEAEAAQEEENLRASEAAMKAQETTAQDRRRELDRKELDLKALEEKVDKLTVQLNTAQTNREYEAFRHEIAVLKADASKIEDESLTMLESLDFTRKRQEEAKAKVKQAEAAHAAKKGEIAALQQAVDREVAELQKKREDGLVALKPTFREMYERLHAGHGGQAVVGARGGACGGCFMNLTSNTINHLMAENELIRCHSCGRILYLVRDGDEDEEEDE